MTDDQTITCADCGTDVPLGDAGIVADLRPPGNPISIAALEVSMRNNELVCTDCAVIRLRRLAGKNTP